MLQRILCIDIRTTIEDIFSTWVECVDIPKSLNLSPPVIRSKKKKVKTLGNVFLSIASLRVA